MQSIYCKITKCTKYHNMNHLRDIRERQILLDHVIKCTQATLSDHILSNLDIEM